jgi:hypothetical protein
MKNILPAPVCPNASSTTMKNMLPGGNSDPLELDLPQEE